MPDIVMKTLGFALLTLALALTSPLQADDGIQNGDFTDGITHWHGDGRSPADFASDNPMAPADPLTSKGLIIPLKHTAWSKVAQDFRSKTGTGTLSITFIESPDLTFSTKPEDYQNMPSQLGWGWKTFDIPPGCWMVSVNDSTGTVGFHSGVKPDGAPGTVHTFRVSMKGKPDDTNTLTICIPPGTGNFIVLNVSLIN